jgi:biopolymer transport protein ExbD
MAVKIDKGIALTPLNLIPMIDCVLFLLIFFLMASHLDEQERQLDIVLPEASEAQPLVSKPRETYVNIDQTGRFMVSGKWLTLAELEQALHRAWANNPGRVSVVIRADAHCQVQYLVAAMNACNKAKIRDYRITTRDAKG